MPNDLTKALNSPKLVHPVPGLCFKATEINSKFSLYINICHHDLLESPPNLSDSELVEAIQNLQHNRYKIPMAFSEIKLKKGIYVMDVMISSQYFEKLKSSLLHFNFIQSLCFSKIELENANLNFSRENIEVLKNGCFGSLSEFHINPKRSKLLNLVQEQSKHFLALEKFLDIFHFF